MQRWPFSVRSFTAAQGSEVQLQSQGAATDANRVLQRSILRRLTHAIDALSKGSRTASLSGWPN
ncbi:MAG: hypothetical protein CMJ78_08255 [Planctomycetaceae bacterium]|nr:hypothetical protein [Planctomycetaceae bacterium]